VSPLTRRVVLGAVVAAIATATGYGTARWRREAAPQPAAAGRVEQGPAQAADFLLPDLDGKTRVLKEWQGKLVLLNFWATWCPPCREEIPLFVELQRRHGPAGLQIVGVAYDNPQAVRDFVHAGRLNYPQLLGGDQALALMASYGNRSGSLPFSALIGPDGQILARKIGAYRQHELEQLVVPQLPGIKDRASSSN
jgi:thiol-disulfide isomerase/thioredoxin